MPSALATDSGSRIRAEPSSGREEWDQGQKSVMSSDLPIRGGHEEVAAGPDPMPCLQYFLPRSPLGTWLLKGDTEQ